MFETYLHAGPIINTTKTEILSASSPDAPTLSISGKQLKTENFIYLDPNLSFSGDLTNKIHKPRLLESFHIRRLQLILGLRWWHKVTHSEIRSRAGIPSIESILLLCQLRWLGHTIRMPDSRLYPLHALWPTKTRPQGRWWTKETLQVDPQKMQHSI